MREPLRPCAACARHVRASDAACPFCGAATLAATNRETPRIRLGGPLSARAAYIAGVGTLGVLGSALGACDRGAPRRDDSMVVAAYGVAPPPFVDAGVPTVDAAAPVDAVDAAANRNLPVPAYGVAPQPPPVQPTPKKPNPAPDQTGAPPKKKRTLEDPSAVFGDTPQEPNRK